MVECDGKVMILALFFEAKRSCVKQIGIVQEILGSV
jgi:hypothetical protein